MWESIKKDPMLKAIIFIFGGIVMLSLTFLIYNMLFGAYGNMLNYHYSMMYDYNAVPGSILAVLAKLLLLASSISFIISLAVYFIKGVSNVDVLQNNEDNGSTLNTNTKGVELKPSDDVEKENENNKPDNENTTEAIEKDDLISRLYQKDINKKKYNKKSRG